ncbi:MAG TPA: glutamyl-tRNA reductase [Gammaproteobacteria bacterium]|nr:glutamyl-tRNA reductase [Gammaproteobacteria bacterium]
MPIFVCGLNHKTAPIALREKIYFAPEKLTFYLQDLLNNGLVSEAVVLSTCNRSELYCEADNAEKITEWFARQWPEYQQDLLSMLYVHQDQEAIDHIMRVACGLDSMVLGEPEILGQVKTAFSESCTAGAVGSSFHRLFQHVFAIAKEVRSSTAIGACPVSIASTTITLAKRLISFPDARMVLLGAGDMIELILRYLKAAPVQKAWVVNRNLEKAQELTRRYAGEARSITDLAEVLPKANILITATGSLKPLITASLLKETLAGHSEPFYIFDIAVPRDVEAEAGEVASVKLYCIDDLKAIIQENHVARQHAADKAEELIKKRSSEFFAQLASQDQVSDTIRAYRKQIEAICDAELDKALRQLALSPESDAEKILRQFAYAITNKLLHAPSVQLRQAGSEGRLDILRLAKQLFAIPELDSII